MENLFLDKETHWPMLYTKRVHIISQITNNMVMISVR